MTNITFPVLLPARHAPVEGVSTVLDTATPDLGRRSVTGAGHLLKSAEDLAEALMDMGFRIVGR